MSVSQTCFKVVQFFVRVCLFSIVTIMLVESLCIFRKLLLENITSIKIHAWKIQFQNFVFQNGTLMINEAFGTETKHHIGIISDDPFTFFTSRWSVIIFLYII